MKVVGVCGMILVVLIPKKQKMRVQNEFMCLRNETVEGFSGLKGYREQPAVELLASQEKPWSMKLVGLEVLQELQYHQIHSEYIPLHKVFYSEVIKYEMEREKKVVGWIADQYIMKPQQQMSSRRSECSLRLRPEIQSTLIATCVRVGP